MQAVPLTGGPVSITGALDVEETRSGVRVRRLPAWTRPQHDQLTASMSSYPSGVRVELTSDTRSIELDVMLTRVDMGGGVGDAVFDLVVDDDQPISRRGDGGVTLITDARDPGSVEQRDGAACSLVFDGLATGPKQLAIWLPQAAMVELRALRVDDGASTAAPDRSGRRRWVHHGSSISHCMEADAPTGTWPVVASRLAGVEVLNLGLGGSCHLDQFVARTMRDEPADLLSLKAGINVFNFDSLRERTFAPALHGFIDTVRDGHRDTPFLVVSPIFCPSGEGAPGPTVFGPDGKAATVPGHHQVRVGALSLARMREIISRVVEQRRGAGDPNLHYLDGLELFGPADASDLPDGLHPNPAGYRRIGERFSALAFGPGGAFAM